MSNNEIVLPQEEFEIIKALINTQVVSVEDLSAKLGIDANSSCEASLS
jgi:hypothetical protein